MERLIPLRPCPPLPLLLLVLLLLSARVAPGGAVAVITRAYVLPPGAAPAHSAPLFAARAAAVVVPGASGAATQLVVGAGGGDLVALEGSGFGAGGASPAAGACIFTPWRFRPSPAVSGLLCDGLESSLGEGEIAQSQVRFWNDSLAVFAASPGLGARLLTLSVPGAAGVYADYDILLAYSAPTLLAVSPASGDAEGGAPATISGRGFGPSTVDPGGARPAFPMALSAAPSVPTAGMYPRQNPAHRP